MKQKVWEEGNWCRTHAIHVREANGVEVNIWQVLLSAVSHGAGRGPNREVGGEEMLVFLQPCRCLVVTPAVVADSTKGAITSEFRDNRQGHFLVQTAWPNSNCLWAIFHFLG